MRNANRQAGLFTAMCAASVAILLGGGSPLRAQESDDSAKAIAEIRAHYTKYEFRIPMRDGAKLFTAVYVPKDASSAKTYPFLIERTPYSVGPYGADNYPKHLGPAPSFV